MILAGLFYAILLTAISIASLNGNGTMHILLVSLMLYEKETTKIKQDILFQTKFSKERLEMIRELSKRVDVYERLAHAVAPSVYEHDDIKKGILLQVCRVLVVCV